MAPHPAAAPSGMRVALLLGTLVALTVIASSAVAVALPRLAADLVLGPAASAWVFAAFALPFALSTALFGRLADLAGLRRPLWIGVTLLTAGSLVAAAATTFPVLVAGRLLQGAGGGSVPVLSVAILSASVPEEQRGRALGALTAVVAIVSGSGPLIGGALTQLAGWRAVLALPAVALALAVPISRLSPPATGRPGRLDVRGLLLVTVAVAAFMLLLQGPGIGLGAGGMALLGAVAAGGAGLQVAHVRARPAGFLPRAVVTNGPLVRASLAAATLLAAYVAGLFSVPTMLTAGQGWAPLVIGAAMLPAAALAAAGSRLAGGLAGGRLGRLLVVAVALASAAGLLLAGALPQHPVLVVAGFGLVATGFGAGQVVLIEAVPRFVEPAFRGAALGVFNLVFFTGSALGAAAVGGLAEALPLPAALAVMAVLPAAGAALAATVDTARL